MTKRTERLEPSVRKIIAPILRECPRECGIVTITKIDVSPDLSYATIYISALMKPKAALEFLESRQRELQKLMGNLQTHKTPHIRFRLDTTAEEGSRMEKLLQ
ncbi:MAG: ribosome-binding factor A [Candidatus Peribacteraceae bacterium]|nr:ribosome-binding factor A [Candidatus Peribacteraceae bacterium]